MASNEAGDVERKADVTATLKRCTRGWRSAYTRAPAQAL